MDKPFSALIPASLKASSELDASRHRLRNLGVDGTDLLAGVATVVKSPGVPECGRGDRRSGRVGASSHR